MSSLQNQDANILKTPMGILTALTKKELKKILYRTNNINFTKNKEKDLLISTHHHIGHIKNINDLSYVNCYDDLQRFVNEVNSLDLEQERNMILFDIHAREYCGALHPHKQLIGALCSSYEEYENNRQCAHGLSCYTTENIKRVDVSKINAPIIFAPTC